MGGKVKGHNCAKNAKCSRAVVFTKNVNRNFIGNRGICAFFLYIFTQKITVAVFSWIIPASICVSQ
jgi:hypothetical protein